jgi:hypothetical protein
MSLYYKIWSDCITRLRSLPKNQDNWQIKSMVIMSTSMTFNLILLMMVLQREVFGHFFYEINLPSLTGFENYAITMLVLYLSPCVIINYLLIFRKKRYIKIMEKYPYYNGKLSLGYFLISLFLPIVLMWIGIIYTRYF